MTNALKFLKLTDVDDNTTESMHLLQSEGEIFTQNLAKIVQEAYSDLTTSVQIDKAKPEHVYSYFTDRKKVGYTLAQAKKATKFFVWLATLAGIEVSSELKKLSPDPNAKPRGPKQSRIKNDDLADDTDIDEDLHETKVVRNIQAVVPQKSSSSASNIQATITMALDKDTPVEVWRMVLRLLGLSDREEPTSDLPN